MAVYLSSITFDILGAVEIEPLPGSVEKDTARRATVSPTLNQGVVLSDGGFAEGDRIFDYNWKTISKAHNDLILRLQKTYSLLWLSNDEGFYSVSFMNLQRGDITSSMSLRVIEKLS